jgi:hypothetical protein
LWDIEFFLAFLHRVIPVEDPQLRDVRVVLADELPHVVCDVGLEVVERWRGHVGALTRSVIPAYPQCR